MIKLSVRRPLTILVLVVIIVVLGVVSFTNMTTDLLPNINLPYVVVVTTYPGASPEQVEISVTKPIESALSRTTDLKNITSTSSENVSMVMLEFSQDANMDSVFVEVSQSLNSVSGSFDESVSAPYMLKINPNSLPIMITAVSYEGMDTSELSVFAEETLLPKLETTEGVASVSSQGIISESVEIVISEDKIDEINKLMLRSVDSQLAEAQDALDEASAEIAAGKNALNSTYTEKTNEILSAKELLEAGQSDLSEKEQELLAAESQLEMAENIVALEYAFINNQRSEANTLKAEFLIRKSETEALPDSPEKQAELEIINAQLTALDGVFAALDAAEKEIDTQNTEVSANRTAIDEGKAGIEAGKTEISNQIAALEEAKAMLESGISSARSQLNSAEAEVSKQTSLLEDARDKALENAAIDGIITVELISSVLAAENFDMPAGYVDNKGIPTVVKVGDEIISTNEIEDLLLFDLGLEYVDKVYLSDVADVNYVDTSEEIYAKIDGKDGIVFIYTMQSTYSTTEVVDAIKENMASLEEKYEGLSFVNMMDQGDSIDMIISTVLSNLLMGALLSIIVLFLFLRSIKPTLIVAASIPISVILAIVLMYFSGITLNIISLAGLALGVGMLVDNSIVVIENTYRLKAQGMSGIKAALYGAKEMAPAITGSTLTTICVFLPVLFTDGLTRQLFMDMALTITYSLAASLLVALTVVPAVARPVLNNFKPVKFGSSFGDAIQKGYEKVLCWCLRFKPVVIIAIVALFCLSAVTVFSNGAILMPEMESLQMTATISLPEDMKKEEQFVIVDELSAELMDIQDVESVGVIVAGDSGAMNMLTGGGNSNDYSAYVNLKEDKTITNAEVSDIIKDIAENYPVEISIAASNMDMSALSGGSGIQITLTGNNYDDMMMTANDLVDIISEVDGVIDADAGIGKTSKEVRIIVDKDKAMLNGLTVAQVYQQVAGKISDGYTATSIYESGKELPLIVIDEKAQGMQVSDVKNILIDLPEQSMSQQSAFKLPEAETEDEKEEKASQIKLSEIADIEIGESPDSINRVEQQRTINVTANVDSSHNITHVNSEIEEKVASYDVPASVNLTFEGETTTIMETIMDMAYIMVIAVLLIYLIMVVQFQSLKSPFIVMFTIPLAFTGGFLALLMCGYVISLIALLGVLLLAGIVVNNGIVLVDTINRNRIGGEDRKTAIINAGKTRMRPVLMTALTTIFGMMTLSLGMGTGADMLQPMAVVVIGGLIYATVLTLFFIPVVYDIFNKKELKRTEIEEDTSDEK